MMLFRSFFALGILIASPVFAADTSPDPFLAPESGAEEAAPSLSSPTPSSGDNPSPSLGQETSPPANETSEAKPSPAPTAAAAEPVKKEETPAVPAQTNHGKGIYEQYEDYLVRERERRESETDLTQRALFPHENGFWQIQFEYIRNAFGDYDFNSKNDSRYGKTFAETSGPGASILVFPLRSLDFGRLGLGFTGAYYWSQFTLGGPSGNVIDKPSGGSIYTYGVKAVYEFDYWLGQILVPFVYYGYDQVFVRAYAGLVNGVKVTDFPSYRTTAQSYGAGVHFNLNRLEPVVASRALANVGVRKFYITYRANQHTGSFSGLTHALGLSFEF